MLLMILDSRYYTVSTMDDIRYFGYTGLETDFQCDGKPLLRKNIA